MGVDTNAMRCFARVRNMCSTVGNTALSSVLDAAADEIDALRAEVERKDSLVRSLLNKVNRVSAFYRHGRIIPEQCLVDLSNGQIDFQDAYDSPKESPCKP